MHFSLTPTERMSNHARVYALRADGDEFAEVARVKRDGHTFWLIVDSDLTSEAWKAAKALGDARTFSGLAEIKAWIRALNWHHGTDEADDPEWECPECGGDTDNTEEDCDGETVSTVPLPCDDCAGREACDGCGCSVHADEIQDWPHYAQGKPWGMLCPDCWRQAASSPAEDGRW